MLEQTSVLIFVLDQLHLTKYKKPAKRLIVNHIQRRQNMLQIII